MWKELAKQLGLGDDATEEQTRTKLAAVIVAANEQAQTKDVIVKAGFQTVTDALAKVGTLTTELTTEKGKVAANEQMITTLKTEKTTAEQAANVTKVNFANERKARAEMILNNGIAAGKITEADRQKWVDAFANETSFEAKVSEFNAIQPTAGGTQRLDLGNRHSQQAQASPAMTQVVAEAKKIMANEKVTWDEAWNRVKGTHSALFATMQQPGKK